jgi:hypothetical protein
MKCNFGYSLFIAALIVFAISCSNGNGSSVPYILTVGEISQDTIFKWNSFVMSSTPTAIHPLEYQPSVRLLDIIGGDGIAVEDMPFYLPGYIATTGDTLVISDISAEKLISMKMDGTINWSIGGQGEGPGYFHGIGRLEILNDNIYVCNNRNTRVDIISIEGVYKESISIMRPQNVIAANDSLIVIISKQEPGGDCHIYNVNTSVIEYSFGNGNWHELLRNNPGIGAVYGECFADSFIVYGAQEQTECYIYNIYSGTYVSTLTRELPSVPFQPETIEQNGRRVTVYVPITSDLFISPDNCINVVFPTYLCGGKFMEPLDSEYDFAPVTIIDKYSFDGEYLYSYSLPDSLLGEIEILDDGSMLARQLPTASILLFELAGSLQGD